MTNIKKKESFRLLLIVVVVVVVVAVVVAVVYLNCDIDNEMRLCLLWAQCKLDNLFYVIVDGMCHI
jgi:hypothetical protein